MLLQIRRTVISDLRTYTQPGLEIGPDAVISFFRPACRDQVQQYLIQSNFIGIYLHNEIRRSLPFR